MNNNIDPNEEIKKIESIFKDEANNFNATKEKFANEVVFLNRLIELHQTLSKNLETYPRDLIPILQMYWISFRALLVSSTLALQAHIPESFALISRAAEAVASAWKMSLHPHKIPGWIKKEKETSQPFRRILGELFPKGDKVLSPEIYEIYDTTTEHGRHPNFASTIFFTSFGRLNTENKIDFTYCDIEDETNLLRMINYLINAYIKFLFVFKIIFKEYLSKEWIKELDNLNNDYNTYKETLKEKFKL